MNKLNFLLHFLVLNVSSNVLSYGKTDQYDMNPAMQAAAKGNLSDLKLAVKDGIDLKEINSNGASVLYYAAQSQKQTESIFEYIRKNIGKTEFEILMNRQVISNGHTVVLEAVFNSNAELVRYLLKLRDKGLNIDFESPTVFGWTPRSFAEREKLGFAAELPLGKVQPEQRLEWMKTQEDSWQKGLSTKEKYFHSRGMELIRAIESFDEVKVNNLVLAGVEINECYGRLGATPLNSSVRPGLNAADVVRVGELQKLLLSLGANPNFSEGGIMRVPSGFREAVFGYSSLIQSMIESFDEHSSELKMYLNFQGPLNGYTKLIDAALRGRADVINVLMEAGADRKIKGHNGLTAYDTAKIFNKNSNEKISLKVLELLKN